MADACLWAEGSDRINVQNDPVSFTDYLGLKLSLGQNIAVSLISSIAATVGTAIGSPVLGAGLGAVTGFFASLALGGDLTDALNNAISGGLSGFVGGYFGKLVATAGPKATGMGFLFDLGFDAILLGADPIFPGDPCN